MNMNTRFSISTLIFLVVGTGIAAAPPATRRWTDHTGEFSTDAELVEVKQDNVALRKASGSTVTVPLARLSDADREYLKNQSRADTNVSNTNHASPNLNSPDSLTEPPVRNDAPVRWSGMERYPLRAGWHAGL